MVKYVYCIRRKAGMSADEFHAPWRSRHATLIRGHASNGAMRYVQCHTLDTSLSQAFADSHGFGIKSFDGVTELWWDSMDDFIATNGSPEGMDAAKTYLADEGNFIDVAGSVAFLTEEYTVFDFTTAQPAQP